MPSKNTKKGLGRGLDSLLDTERVNYGFPKTSGSLDFAEIDINKIQPNPNQPRTDFDPEALAELAESIRQNGIISPITVRKMDDGNYQIIAGERRYRASQIAELSRIPAYIRNVDEQQVLEMALIENIQRADLNAVEIALSYNGLIEVYGLTQEQIADRVGKKRATVANYLRLLSLPADIQLGLKQGDIEMGHARALAGVDDTTRQLDIYRKVIAEGASVRRTEELCKKAKDEKKPKPVRQAEIADIEEGLSLLLNSKVHMTYNAEGKGKIEIRFANDDELERLMKRFELLKEQ